MRQYTSSEEKKETPSENTKKDASASLLKTDSILFNRITDYYEAHITEHIKVEHLCKEFGIGRSHLQRIFREQTGYGAIEYFCQMRISAAKRCIRENRMNLTDTAASLGYTSIYYFSKQFKKITGMSPSQYQKMVRSSKKDPLYEQRELWFSLQNRRVDKQTNKRIPLLPICDFRRGVLNARLCAWHPTLAPRPQIGSRGILLFCAL